MRYDKAAVRYCSQCRTPYSGEERFCPVDGGAIVAEDQRDDPLIGVTLDGRYLVRRRIGQGGMGVVYEADHVALDKRVAIKFLLDKYTEDREVLARFHQEARTASRIGHDNIIDIIDIGEAADGRSFIVMELLDGADLAHVLAHTGPMHPERAIRIIRQVLAGLAAAHEKGIVHRDMKPENVFLASRGDREDIVKIMDFGISKIIDAHDSKVRLTETGAVIGTPIYMAPEQARAEQAIDQRVDLYAVGIMFYEMLCGRPPFLASSYLELVTQHLFDPPKPMRDLRPELPPALDQITLRALAKQSSDRWGSANEMAAALPAADAFTGGIWDATSTISGPAPDVSSARAAVAPAPTTGPDRPAPRKSLAPYLIVGGALLAAGIMVAVTMALVGSDGSSEPPVAAAAAVADAGPIEPPPAPVEPVVESLDSVLEIDSRPTGAQVFVDDELRGETPLVLRGIRPGVHQLRVARAGYQTVEVARDLEEGDTETFFAALAKAGSTRRSKVTRTRARRTPASEPPAGEPPTSEPPTGEPPASKPGGVTKPDRKPNPYLDRKPNPYN